MKHDEDSGADSPSTAASPDDDAFNLPGPIRRHAGLLLLVAAGFILGPVATRLLGSYRAVVLDVRDDEMFIAQDRRPPKWVGAIDVEPGAFVEKQVGSWSLRVALNEEPADEQLKELHARYILAYTGSIVAINPPVAPGAASTAVIETESGGRRLHVPLWAEHFAAAAVGRRVEKRAGHWDPILLPEEVASQAPSP